MNVCLRYRFALLAVMVAVSHVTLVSHVTAHFTPALDQCELCVSQAQPLAAIPTADQCAVLPLASIAARPTPPERPSRCERHRPYLQRAPPLPST